MAKATTRESEPSPRSTKTNALFSSITYEMNIDVSGTHLVFPDNHSTSSAPYSLTPEENSFAFRAKPKKR